MSTNSDEFELEKRNEIGQLGFSIHRERGPEHCENYCDHVINPIPDTRCYVPGVGHCDCLERGKFLWESRHAYAGMPKEIVLPFDMPRRIIIL